VRLGRADPLPVDVELSAVLQAFPPGVQSQADIANITLLSDLGKLQ